MNSWCSASDVAARVVGAPSVTLCQEFADQATDILYEMSGRRFFGVKTVSVGAQVNRRGYIKLNDWQPVSDVTAVTINGSPITYALSPAGTFVVVDEILQGQVATLTLVVGQNPPQSAKSAAAALAADLLRADERYAALPGATDVQQQSRVLSVARQGVTYTFIDPVTLQQKDMTGIQSVDMFLRAVNPNGSRYQPKVVSTT